MLPITITICLTLVTVALIAARCYGEHTQTLTLRLADAQRLLVRAERERDALSAAAACAPAIGAKVAVTLPSGELIRGEMAGGDDKTAVLEHAELVAGGAVQPLGGRQHVARYWLQEIPS